jgi:N utilization substance protein B
MSNKKEEHNAKRLARLAAVQGLYQIALTQVLPEQAIVHFRDHPEAFLPEGETALPKPDAELFAAIVSGVSKNLDALDGMIAGALSEKLSAGRIEILLRAILRAGAFELHHHGSIQSGVIINDYVDVAHAFFGAKEPGLVNAILDKLAKTLRS